jgi:hypothetical protein
MDELAEASGKQRSAAWAALAADAAALPPADVAAAVLSTLGYNDKASRCAVEEALKAALKQPGFAAALLAALRAASLRGAGQQHAQTLLRWSALLAPHLEVTSSAFAKLAGVQSLLLAALTSGTAPRARRRVSQLPAASALPRSRALTRAPSCPIAQAPPAVRAAVARGAAPAGGVCRHLAGAGEAGRGRVRPRGRAGGLLPARAGAAGAAGALRQPVP